MEGLKDDDPGKPKKYSVDDALHRMSSTDRDYRYMALSDLLNQLQAGRQLKPEDQVKVYKKVMVILEDPSSEVQGMAMRCFPWFLKYAPVSLAEDAARKLADNLIRDSDKSSHGQNAEVGLRSIRDVSSLLLKTTFAELAPTSEVTKSIISVLVPVLLQKGLAPNAKVTLQVDCLELMKDLLHKFPETMSGYHDDIAQALLQKVSSPTQTIRKKSAGCLATLCESCSQQLFSTIMEQILEPLQASSTTAEQTQNRIQVASAISRTAAHRLDATAVSALVQPVFRTMEDLQVENLDLYEAGLQILDSFALMNPSELAKYIDQTLELLERCIKYDPNYAMDDQEMADADEDFDAADAMVEDEDEDDFAYDDDDDDMSWKVRRAACKCAQSIIGNEILEVYRMYQTIGDVLISRLSEREESVKTEVYTALSKALSKVYNHWRDLSPADAMEIDSNDTKTESRAPVEATVGRIRERTPWLTKTICRELSQRSSKNVVGALEVLQELVCLAPDEVFPLLPKIVPELERVIKDPNVQIKSAVLDLIARVDTKSAAIQAMLPLILRISEDRFYKVTAQALSLSTTILTDLKDGPTELKQAANAFVLDVHGAAMKRIVASDQDSEVKVCAVACVGVCASYYADTLGPAAVETARLICDRLGNEVTRLAAVKAIDQLAQSPSAKLLEPMIKDIVSMLNSFLHKKDISLRMGALRALVSLVPFLPDGEDQELLREVSTCIVEQDLQLSALALFLVGALMRARHGANAALVKSLVWDRVLVLATSPLLQGQVLNGMSDLLGAVAQCNENPLKSTNVIEDLQRVVVGYAAENRRSVAQSAAKCVAVLVRESSRENEGAVRIKLADDVASDSGARRLFGLACLAELGRASTMPSDTFRDDLRNTVLKILLESSNEVERSTAAVALGAISSTGGEEGVDFFLKLLHSRPEKRYLLLISLKETITFTETKVVANYSSKLLPLLLEDEERATGEANGQVADQPSSTDAGKDSLRTATAECLGLLARADPHHVVGSLEEIYSGEARSMSLRTSAVMAIKYAIGMESTAALDAVLKNRLPAIAQLLPDPEDVQATQVPLVKGALLSLDAVARVKPALLLENHKETLERVYKLLKGNPRLVRSINLGPFKYNEDDGVDIRKTAFTFLGTLLARAPRLVDMTAYGEALASGLKDAPEVRSLAQFNLLAVLRSPMAHGILTSVEVMVASLTAVLSEKPSVNAVVHQEKDKHEEQLRGAMRVVIAMEAVPGIAVQDSFATMKNNIVQTPELQSKYETMSKETA